MSLPSRGGGSRNSGERMEPAGPCLASLPFGQGSTADPKSFCQPGRGEEAGLRARVAPGAEPAAASPAAGRQPHGGHFGRGAGRPFAEAETEAAGLAAAWWTQTEPPSHNAQQQLQRFGTVRQGPRRAGSTPQPTLPEGQGVRFPSRTWGNSKTIIMIPLIIKKKLCKRPSTLSCRARTPKRTRYVTV